jgi:nucleoside-diphosphate-sugar epimerase
MMRRLLFTGAGGFIGSRAVPYLLERGFEVHAVGRRPFELEGCTAHTANLLDASEAKRVIEQVRPTHLLHLAWYVEHGKFWTSPENTRWVEASIALLREFAEHGGRRVLTAGTCSEYETGHALCVENETPSKPATLYGACKYALSVLQTAMCRQMGVSSGWGRVFFLYGPGEPERKLVSSVITSLLRGEAAATTHGEQVRDFLHVEDVARGLVAALDSDLEGAVNIGSGEPVTQRHVVETIARLIGRPDLLQLGAVPAGANDPTHLIPDVSRLRSTGFTPKYTLESGLAETIEWWKKDPGTASEGPMPGGRQRTASLTTDGGKL